MDYLKLIGEVLTYIENSVDDIDMEVLSREFGLSKFFLNRLFRAVTNQTLIKYYRSNRLRNSCRDLLETKSSIIDIALDYGYNSHEAYSRAFKKEFGISPKEFIRDPGKIDLKKELTLIHRKLQNFKNELLPEYKIIEMDQINLKGRHYSIPATRDMVGTITVKRLSEFFKERLDFENVYFVCQAKEIADTGENNNSFFDFGVFGKEEDGNGIYGELESYILKKSRYLQIKYRGHMENQWDVVGRDLFKIMIAKEVEGLTTNSLDNWLMIYRRSWFETREFIFNLPLD